MQSSRTMAVPTWKNPVRVTYAMWYNIYIYSIYIYISIIIYICFESWTNLGDAVTPRAARFVQFQDKGPELAGHLGSLARTPGALCSNQKMSAWQTFLGRTWQTTVVRCSKQFQHHGRRETLKLPARAKWFKNSKVSFFRNCETEVEQVAGEKSSHFAVNVMETVWISRLRVPCESLTTTGWWFGTWLLFSPIFGMMIQSDELIFFRGVGIPPRYSKVSRKVYHRIGWRENFNRKPLYLMVKTMVSCRFSQQNQSIVPPWRSQGRVLCQRSENLVNKLTQAAEPSKLPSGYVTIASGHGHRNSWFTH